MRTYVKSLLHGAKMYIEIRDYNSAQNTLAKADFYADGADHKAEILILRAQIHGVEARLDKAIDLLQTASDLLKNIDMPGLSATLFSRLAAAYYENGRYEEAVKCGSVATELLEKLRSRIASPGLRQSFHEMHTASYRTLIAALVALDQREKAFDVSERARARSLIDVLGPNNTMGRSAVRGLIDKEQELNGKIIYLKNLISEAEADVVFFRDDTPDGQTDIPQMAERKSDAEVAEQPEVVNLLSDKAMLKEQLNKALAEYSALLASLRQTDSETTELMMVEPSRLADIRVLLPENTTMVSYFVLPQYTVVWAISKDQIVMKKISISRDVLHGQVTALRTGIEKMRPQQAIARMSSALYRTLLGDVAIKENQALLIVPNDFLHYLPFQSLITPEGKYLVEKYDISYLSSASLLRYVVGKSRKANDSILALGNPDLNDIAKNLNYAEREVKEISTVFQRAEVYIGKEATRSRVQHRSPGFSILHFATHGELDDANPMESSLRLAVDGTDSGRLTTRDIFNLNLRASLVVLSACETALGKIAMGDEVIGFTRAFIYAGAPSVVTTLWKIDDQATALLMQDFYKNLMTNNKSGALRSAQINLMKKYPHPYYWSPFILSGDYR